MRAPCNVGEGLVDGDALDGRREIAQHADGGVTEPLVFFEMSADENEVATELPRAPSRHAASYAEGPRFVGGREHDAAADRYRLAAQPRVKQLFDRRIKGVEVRMENGGCGTHLVASSPWPQCMTAYWTTVSQWVCAQASTAESVSVHRSIICQPRITPTTARTRVATRGVLVRRSGAAPLERQLQSSASAPSSTPVADRRMRG